MTITPQGNGAATAALGPMTVEQGLAAFKARNPNAKPSDVVTPSLPEDEVEDLSEVEHEEPEAEAIETETQEGEIEAEAEAKPAADPRKIMLPDGEEITVEEARKGYLRNRDYTQKTQRVAEDHRALVTEKSVWAEKAGSMLKNLDALQEKEPNWLELRRSGQYTAEQYQEIQAWWQNRQSTVKAAQDAVVQAQREEHAIGKRRFYDELLSGRFEPTWKDQAVLKADLGKVYEFAGNLGYAPEVLDGFTDPQLMSIINDARRWREANSKRPVVTKAVAGKPAVAKPGARSVATPRMENARSAAEKFGKSGKIDDAVALFNARNASRQTPIRR